MSNVIIAIDHFLWKKEIPNIRKLTKLIVNDVLKSDGNVRSTVEVIYSNDDLLRKLNMEYNGKDSPTNVLSFLHTNASELYMHSIGEIFISFESIKCEAIAKNIPFASHTTHILVHGLLHLLGHTHDKINDSKIMKEREISILAKMNIENPYK